MSHSETIDLPRHDHDYPPGTTDEHVSGPADERREPEPLSIPDAVDALLDRHDSSQTCAALREQAEEILTDDYLAEMVRAAAKSDRAMAAQLGISLADRLYHLAGMIDVGTYAARLDADMAE